MKQESHSLLNRACPAIPDHKSVKPLQRILWNSESLLRRMGRPNRPVMLTDQGGNPVQEIRQDYRITPAIKSGGHRESRVKECGGGL